MKSMARPRLRISDRNPRQNQSQPALHHFRQTIGIVHHAQLGLLVGGDLRHEIHGAPAAEDFRSESPPESIPARPSPLPSDYRHSASRPTGSAGWRGSAP